MKKQMKKGLLISLGILGAGVMMAPVAMSLVSCNNNDSTKTETPNTTPTKEPVVIPSADVIQKETDAITTIPDAVKYMNEFLSKYYSAELFIRDFQQTGWDFTDSSGLKHIRDFIDISINPDKTVNFTLIDGGQPNNTYESSYMKLTFKNMPIVPVLTKDENSNILVAKWALKYYIQPPHFGDGIKDPNQLFDQAPETNKPLIRLETFNITTIDGKEHTNYKDWKWTYLYTGQGVDQNNIDYGPRYSDFITFNINSVDLAFDEIENVPANPHAPTPEPTDDTTNN